MNKSTGWKKATAAKRHMEIPESYIYHSPLPPPHQSVTPFSLLCPGSLWTKSKAFAWKSLKTPKITRILCTTLSRTGGQGHNEEDSEMGQQSPLPPKKNILGKNYRYWNGAYRSIFKYAYRAVQKNMNAKKQKSQDRTCQLRRWITLGGTAVNRSLMKGIGPEYLVNKK